MNLSALDNYLEDLFSDYSAKDYCKNGLQIEGKEQVNNLAFAVSFNLQTARKTLELNADALITHHGVFGYSFFDFSGPSRLKSSLFIQNGISLFSFHLPLDMHREIGNNAVLHKIIGSEIIDSVESGYIGQNKNNLTLEEISLRYFEHLKPSFYKKGRTIINPLWNHYSYNGFDLLKNNDKIPGRIAVISGAGSDYIPEVIKKGADLLISGELKIQTPEVCYESNLNYLNLGHYYSEKTGILALKDVIEKKFGISCHYIEMENII